MIIADEPTGNIDPELSYEIVELLTEINRRGTTIVMVTHEHDLVRMFHRRVIEISDGCVVSDTGMIPPEEEEPAAPSLTVDDVLSDIGMSHSGREGGRL